jgi:putative Ca2+/H+ antiporter (TMEM165/GDT1 family)
LPITDQKSLGTQLPDRRDAVCPAELRHQLEFVIEKPETIAPEAANAQAWKVFGSTFITIFLAELGDKTQLSTLLISAEFHAPWTVFAGAATALITTSLLGVLVGRWLCRWLSPKTLDTAAGVMLALIAVWLLWDALYL